MYMVVSRYTLGIAYFDTLKLAEESVIQSGQAEAYAIVWFFDIWMYAIIKMEPTITVIWMD